MSGADRTVGFIGLGVMGRPMARNLLQAGHLVVVHNRSRGPVEELVAEGASPGDGPADVAARSDVVVTCLPDSEDVEGVVLGEGSVLEGASPGLLFIDTSTVRPSTARAVEEAARAREIRALDAPVSGGEEGAIDGTLSIMVGGTPEAFAAGEPVLRAMGSTVVHVGPAGAGQTVKAANQLLVGGALALTSEALVLLETCGVETEAALRVLRGGLAGSAVLDRKASRMASREFAPGFRADLHHKDLGITLDTARDHDVPLPVTALVAQMFVALRAAGRGSLDHSALLTVLEELAGGER